MLREKIKPHVEIIEQHLIKNGTGFLVGNAVRHLFLKCFPSVLNYGRLFKQMTWADIAYYAYLTTPIMTKLGGEVLANAPQLKELIDRVGQVDGIKNYVESRPDSII